MEDKKGSSPDAKKQKYIVLAIGLAVLGVFITYMPVGRKNDNSKVSKIQTTAASSNTCSSYEAALERRLTNILGKMEGVGEVSVMITTVSDDEKVLAENVTTNQQRTEEKPQQGTSRINTSASENRQVVQSGQTPYVIKENKPEIKGVLILAQGADDSGVKEQITEAVSRLLDVPVHKVSVVKKEK